MRGPHPVWFERAVIPELQVEVSGHIAMLGPGTAEDFFEGIEAAAGVVASSGAYDAAVMDRAPGLRVIVRTGIGYDRVDVDAATQRGIAVCNTPDGPTVSTAEHAVALMLAAGKALVGSAAALRTGAVDLYESHPAIEFAGRTLGLVGFGRIARRVAVVAEALGMRAIAHDPYLTPSDFTVERAPTLGILLERSDVVSVHVPLTPETHHLFDAESFASMRRGAVFVNTARGGLVDQDALIQALESGQVRAAALDVTDPEPIPTNHPLLARDDVIVTPHVASATTEGRSRIFRTALRQVELALGDARPEHLVNPEGWRKRSHIVGTAGR